MDIHVQSTKRDRNAATLRRLAVSSGKARAGRSWMVPLGLLFCLALFVWRAGDAQMRRWINAEADLDLIDLNAQDRTSAGLLELKHRLGIPLSPGQALGGHIDAVTTEYYVDQSDRRNRGIRPLWEQAEGKCFADDIPGTEPFPHPRKAPLYAPMTWSSSSDACAEALNTDKVAIMLMAKGEMYHTDVWRQWFASAAGRVPVGLDSSCASLSSVQSIETQDACASFMDTVHMPMSEILDDPLAYQVLFSLYVHVPPGNEGELDDFFRPFLIPRRVEVAWGKASMIYAMRELIWFAFQDPRNTRFVLLSDSDVPIYGPMVFYHQLMAETKSRVDTSGRLNRDTYRWHYRFLCANPPLLEKDWRKSSQWFTLIREHAEMVLKDTSMYRAFERFCHEFWDDAHDWWRVCYSDEHYIPTLLWVAGEGDRTYPVRGPTHVDWSIGGPHPVEYTAQNVTARLVRNKLRVTIDCIQGEQSQTELINTVEETRFVDVIDNWGWLSKGLDDKCRALTELEDARRIRAEDRAEAKALFLKTSSESSESSESSKPSESSESPNATGARTSPLFVLQQAENDDRPDARFACPLAARKFKKETAKAVLKLLESDCRVRRGTPEANTGKLGIIDDRVCNAWGDWKSKN